jgi:protein-S-isoprenylcysteine O-methyltransferase Ste14
MNTELVFRLIALIFTVTLFGLSGYFRRRADREAGALRTREGSGAVKLVRLYMLLAFLPLIAYFINPDWVAWARLTVPEWARWIGAGLAAIALPLGYWVFTSIGANISPTQATRHGHQLVTHGPYRYIRHPLYTTGVLAFLAIALLTAMWWVLVVVVPGVIFIVLRTPKEEARLIETFGDAYRAYARRTGRFLPKLF